MAVIDFNSPVRTHVFIAADILLLKICNANFQDIFWKGLGSKLIGDILHKARAVPLHPSILYVFLISSNLIRILLICISPVSKLLRILFTK